MYYHDKDIRREVTDQYFLKYDVSTKSAEPAPPHVLPLKRLLHSCMWPVLP